MSSSNGIAHYLAKTALFTRNARLVLLFSAFTGLAFGVFRFLFNFYVLSLGPGYDEAFIGTLQTAASLAAIAMALPAAYLADRFSPKSVMVVTGLLSALSFLGMVLFPLRWTLILFRMTAGVSMSIRQVAIAPFLMANSSDDERQWVFSFNFGLATLADFMGSLLGGFLPTWFGAPFGASPTATLSYQLALGSMMLVTIFSISPLLFIRGRGTPTMTTVALPWAQIRRYGRFLWVFLLPQLIVGLGAGLMQPFMNVYFRNVYERPDGAIAILFAVGALGMAVAQFVGAPLSDAIGKLQTVVATQLASVPFLTLLGVGAWAVVRRPDLLGPWFYIAGAAFVFRLGLMNLSNPVYQTFMLEHMPTDVQALTMSLSSIAFQFGWFVMPQVSGWLQVTFGKLGFSVIFGMVALLYVTASLVQIVLMRSGRYRVVPAGV